jgi:hypothetical protein
MSLLLTIDALLLIFSGVAFVTLSMTTFKYQENMGLITFLCGGSLVIIGVSEIISIALGASQ